MNWEPSTVQIPTVFLPTAQNQKKKHLRFITTSTNYTFKRIEKFEDIRSPPVGQWPEYTGLEAPAAHKDQTPSGMRSDKLKPHSTAKI